MLSSDPIRMRLWNNLANVQFKAIYTGECSRFADKVGNIYSFVLSFVSTSSVAAWAIWQKVPWLWAIIVAVSQIMHIAKPHITFIKHNKEFLELSFDLEVLCLKFEQLWYKHENGNIAAEEAEKEFYILRNKEIEIERSHKNVCCPRFRGMINKAQQDTGNVLSRNFV